jgi:hypothetical protein
MMLDAGTKRSLQTPFLGQTWQGGEVKDLADDVTQVSKSVSLCLSMCLCV